jgi:hypothetical protein
VYQAAAAVTSAWPCSRRVPTLEPDPAIAISPAAASQLGVAAGDTALVWVEILEWAP